MLITKIPSDTSKLDDGTYEISLSKVIRIGIEIREIECLPKQTLEISKGESIRILVGPQDNILYWKAYIGRFAFIFRGITYDKSGDRSPNCKQGNITSNEKSLTIQIDIDDLMEDLWLR